MKVISLFTFCFFSGVLVFGQQCTNDYHSTNSSDVWLSCEMSSNPNASRGNTHWLMYDLGHTYTLSSSKFWNYNQSNQTGKGMKNVIIDVSIDGSTWTEAAEFELSEASGTSDYQGDNGPDLENIKARYVLISVLDTWGDACAGLSEVRFDIGELSTSTYDLYVDDSGISLYPNPSPGLFVIKGLLDSYNIDILDINGMNFQNITIDGNESLKEATVDITSLPDGLYFISVHHKNNGNISVQKILKQSE